MLAEANPDAVLPGLAASLNTLSNCLAELGRHQEALGPVEEAVGHYRGLSEANPDVFLPYLAASLNDLSIRFSRAGVRT